MSGRTVPLCPKQRICQITSPSSASLRGQTAVFSRLICTELYRVPQSGAVATHQIQWPAFGVMSFVKESHGLLLPVK